MPNNNPVPGPLSPAVPGDISTLLRQPQSKNVLEKNVAALAKEIKQANYEQALTTFHQVFSGLLTPHSRIQDLLAARASMDANPATEQSTWELLAIAISIDDVLTREGNAKDPILESIGINRLTPLLLNLSAKRGGWQNWQTPLTVNRELLKAYYLGFLPTQAASIENSLPKKIDAKYIDGLHQRLRQLALSETIQNKELKTCLHDFLFAIAKANVKNFCDYLQQDNVKQHYAKNITNPLYAIDTKVTESFQLASRHFNNFPDYKKLQPLIDTVASAMTHQEEAAWMQIAKWVALNDLFDEHGNLRVEIAITLDIPTEFRTHPKYKKGLFCGYLNGLIGSPANLALPIELEATEQSAIVRLNKLMESTIHQDFVIDQTYMAEAKNAVRALKDQPYKSLELKNLIDKQYLQESLPYSTNHVFMQLRQDHGFCRHTDVITSTQAQTTLFVDGIRGSSLYFAGKNFQYSDIYCNSTSFPQNHESLFNQFLLEFLQPFPSQRAKEIRDLMHLHYVQSIGSGLAKVVESALHPEYFIYEVPADKRFQYHNNFSIEEGQVILTSTFYNFHAKDMLTNEIVAIPGTISWKFVLTDNGFKLLADSLHTSNSLMAAIALNLHVKVNKNIIKHAQDEEEIYAKQRYKSELAKLEELVKNQRASAQTNEAKSAIQFGENELSAIEKLEKDGKTSFITLNRRLQIAFDLANQPHKKIAFDKAESEKQVELDTHKIRYQDALKKLENALSAIKRKRSAIPLAKLQLPAYRQLYKAYTQVINDGKNMQAEIKEAENTGTSLQDLTEWVKRTAHIINNPEKIREVMAKQNAEQTKAMESRSKASTTTQKLYGIFLLLAGALLTALGIALAIANPVLLAPLTTNAIAAYSTAAACTLTGLTTGCVGFFTFRSRRLEPASNYAIRKKASITFSGS